MSLMKFSSAKWMNNSGITSMNVPNPARRKRITATDPPNVK